MDHSLRRCERKPSIMQECRRRALTCAACTPGLLQKLDSKQLRTDTSYYCTSSIGLTSSVWRSYMDPALPISSYACNANRTNGRKLSFPSLTLDGDDDLCLHGSARAHGVAGLAAVHRVVVVGRRDEVVHVPALPAANAMNSHSLLSPKFGSKF